MIDTIIYHNERSVITLQVHILYRIVFFVSENINVFRFFTLCIKKKLNRLFNIRFNFVTSYNLVHRL